jgi:predicted membrane channel-forming protein YqfA (hemolysin III family)
MLQLTHASFYMLGAYFGLPDRFEFPRGPLRNTVILLSTGVALAIVVWSLREESKKYKWRRYILWATAVVMVVELMITSVTYNPGP